LPRIVFDISTLLRWSGPPVGIVRTERELARKVKAECPDAVFVFFEARHKIYRQISAAWLDAILAGDVTVLLFDLADPTGRRRRRDRIPAPIRPAVMSVPQLRRTLLFGLEAMRERAGTGPMKTIAARVQQWLMTPKYRRMLFAPDGARLRVVTYSAIVTKPRELAPDDILICVGAGWEHQDIAALAAWKAKRPFRLVTMCYDLMPLMFPQFYQPRDVAAFRRHFELAFPTADLVVVSSQAVQRDVIGYCADHRLALKRTAVVPLGCDPGRTAPARPSALPQGLAPGRFILLVSTIEPRKGHRMIYRVWLQLLAEQVPQKSGFQLVFVGRPGWMVDDLMRDLKSDPRLRGTLRVLDFAGDDELAALYDAAAFCVYPSVYEGFGLPVVEAFARGKAVLASKGGALAETVGAFSPCLDPHDQELWYAMMKCWILEPAARAPYEAAIRARFKPQPWVATAAQFLAAVRGLEHTTAQPRVNA